MKGTSVFFLLFLLCFCECSLYDGSTVKTLFENKIDYYMEKYGIKGLGYAVVSPYFNATKGFGSYTDKSLAQLGSTSKHIAATAFSWMTTLHPDVLDWGKVVGT